MSCGYMHWEIRPHGRLRQLSLVMEVVGGANLLVREVLPPELGDLSSCAHPDIRLLGYVRHKPLECHNPSGLPNEAVVKSNCPE